MVHACFATSGQSPDFSALPGLLRAFASDLLRLSGEAPDLDVDLLAARSPALIAFCKFLAQLSPSGRVAAASPASTAIRLATLLPRAPAPQLCTVASAPAAGGAAGQLGVPLVDGR